MQLKRVLFPVDFSKFSRRTLAACSEEFASESAREFHFVYVWRPPSDMVTWDDPIGIMEVNLKRLVAAFSHEGTHTRVTAVLSGHPALQICNYARRHDCDLIALATHGWTGWRHLIMGSTAEQVIRHAPCSVLTVTRDRAHERVSPACPRNSWGRPRPTTGDATTPAWSG